MTVHLIRALSFVTNVGLALIEQQAKSKLVDFLKATGKIYEIKQTFCTFYNHSKHTTHSSYQNISSPHLTCEQIKSILDEKQDPHVPLLLGESEVRPCAIDHD